MRRLLIDIDTRGCATLRLNNTEQHNAFDDLLIAELTAALSKMAENPQVRLIKLAANGKSFSAGADLNWMRRVAEYTLDENIEDAMGLARLMRSLNELPKPTLALVQGAAFGGGVGLAAACDVVLASEQASFCLSEVRLGLIPAVISPYVIAAIGVRAARRYFLTAERFSAQQALHLGLVHQLVAPEQLEDTAEQICRSILQNGPQALSEAKRLIRDVAERPIDKPLTEMTAQRIAAIRATDEGREGLSAFLEKRPPVWTKED